MRKPIVINMLSSANKVDGQGVGSAYEEQVKLVSQGAPDLFEVRINSIKKSDIVHSHTVDPQNFVRMMNSNTAHVAYVHFLPETLDGSITLPKPIFNVFKAYVISFYKAADYLVVVNPDFINKLVDHGIERDKIVYIPNYVSKDKFYPKTLDERSKLRQKYGIAEDAFVVIGVGQVQMRKGVLDFVEVAKKLPEVNFVWCGGFSFGVITDGYSELKEIVENPLPNVKFLGIIPRDEMNDMYNLADVLFMPSYNELFPMSILEACNLKLPLVLRDLELYRDILFDNYYHGENNDEFVTLINDLKNKPNLYEEGRIKAEHISTYYSKENVLKLWKDFYTKVYNELEDGSLLLKRKEARERHKNKGDSK